MPTVEATVETSQPPDIIAAAFLDPANAVYWIIDLEIFEVISSKPDGVGSVAHMHYIQNDRPYVLEDVLKEIIPNQYFRSEVTGGGLIARVKTWLRERNGSTEVKIRWSGSGSTVLMRVLLPFLGGSIKRQMKSELDVFKNFVEIHGAHFSK